MHYSQQFQIPYSFPVIFARGIFSHPDSQLFSWLPEKKSKCMFVIDSGFLENNKVILDEIDKWYIRYSACIDKVPALVLSGGEAAKNDFAIVETVARHAVDFKLDRHSLIMIVGGGALIDAVGFAASLIHRGIRHVRIPTTVQAQLDSSVGVKNGINYFGQKNFFGCFNTPYAVMTDFNFLSTLGERDFISGFSEAFKVAIIKDKELLKYLIENTGSIRERKMDVVENVIIKTAIIHLDHIRNSGDPFERGSSRPLDFGHWAAHRLEYCTDFKIHHSEAVAVGIAIDMFIAESKGLITEYQKALVLDAMSECGMKLWHPALLDVNEKGKLVIIDGVEQFREHLGGNLTIAMPDGLGNICEIHDLNETIIENAICKLQIGYGEKS